MTSNSSMADRAYVELRTSLLNGDLFPNQRLVELDLTAQIGVNRAAIREALAKLEVEGLVERRANRGAVVRHFSPQEAYDVLQMRIALESLVVAWACERRNNAQLETLKAALKELQGHAVDNDVAGFGAAQGAIHHALLEMAQSPLLAAVVKSLSAQTAMIRRRSLSTPGRLEESLAEHQRIANAVIAGDVAMAVSEMRTHLKHVQSLVTAG